MKKKKEKKLNIQQRSMIANNMNNIQQNTINSETFEDFDYSLYN